MNLLEWGGAPGGTPRDANFLREERGRLGRSVLRLLACLSVTGLGPKIRVFLKSERWFSPFRAADRRNPADPVVVGTADNNVFPTTHS
jgi:hypothetical protein